MGENDTCSWTDAKQDLVWEMRGIDFADLEPFFADAHAVVVEDRRRDYGETRFNMLASHEGVVLAITFTPRRGKYHIVTARLANRKERAIHARAREQHTP